MVVPIAHCDTGANPIRVGHWPNLKFIRHPEAEVSVLLMCRFCCKTDNGCNTYIGYCPVPAIFGIDCCDFEVFDRYYVEGDRSEVIITAILTKLRRMLLKVGQLEDW